MFHLQAGQRHEGVKYSIRQYCGHKIVIDQPQRIVAAGGLPAAPIHDLHLEHLRSSQLFQTPLLNICRFHLHQMHFKPRSLSCALTTRISTAKYLQYRLPSNVRSFSSFWPRWDNATDDHELFNYTSGRWIYEHIVTIQAIMQSLIPFAVSTNPSD